MCLPNVSAFPMCRFRLDESIFSLSNTPVVTGYIWRTVTPMGAQMFVRGIRTWAQDGAEERHLHILNTWGPLVYGPLWWPLPTIFLESKPEYAGVSSTRIRDMCRGGAQSELSSVVSGGIVDDVSRLYGK
jgi:phosphopantetheine adenylyltransferase